MNLNVLWIDSHIDDPSGSLYVSKLKSISSLKLSLFKDVEEAINYMKSIEFQKTIVIVSGKLYSELVKKFKENIKDMHVAPKIIVFTADKEEFLKYNKDYLKSSNIFYTNGGIATQFEEILKIIKTENRVKEVVRAEVDKINEPDEELMIFEYIDSKDKLILPLLFKTLIDSIPINIMEQYTNFVYETYSKNNFELKKLLDSIISLKKIPIELLSKFYARLYSIESNFYKDLNKELKLNKKEKHLPFIKALYEGVKSKSLPLSSDILLYLGTTISKEEINVIKNFLIKKVEGLPGSIVFSKCFLSFLKERNIAEKFFKHVNVNHNSVKVLFILEKDDYIGYDFSTHCDIDKISFYPYEEVLFFPFSSFEIKAIESHKEIYIIRLLYLGKYLKEIENDNNINIDNNKIPDSEFKNQLLELGLIKKEKIGNLYNEYKEYENENDNNIIIGDIKIAKDDINKNIQIINSYENAKKTDNHIEGSKNEKDIKENIEIKINKKVIGFSYFYKFKKEGDYTIEYLFKKNLTNLNYIFYKCDKLINLDLSNFNTQQVTDMSYMFSDCISLKNLELSDLNTQNVTNMQNMFFNCKSLTNLDLSDFDTKNVTNMENMFSFCSSLKNLNASNFNVNNITRMNNIFHGCKSSKNSDLSNFKKQNI